MIAKKHAQSYMPNGELSLEQVIQAAIDEAGQSASVPVVGEPVAWLNECLLKLNHPVMPYISINEPDPDKSWRITPLYKAPTTSITAAELSELFERVISAQGFTDERLLNLMKRTLP